VAALALVAAHLSRLCEELVLWSSAEFGFIRISDGYATGSSIMPQKRNPDMAELIRGKTGRVYGHLVGLLTVLKGLPLAYNKDLQEDKEAYFDAVDTSHACLAITAEMLRTAVPRTERMSATAAADFATATDFADHLVTKGMPFREAHGVIGELIRNCEARGVDLPDLSLAELQAASPLFGPEIVGLTAERVAAARDVPGGTAPRRVREALGVARARWQALGAEVERRRHLHPDPTRLLSDPL
jgi:argininosuccinate lyase